jgi:hypothetical protein
MGSAQDPGAGPYPLHPRRFNSTLQTYGRMCIGVEPWAGAKPRPFSPPFET